MKDNRIIEKGIFRVLIGSLVNLIFLSVIWVVLGTSGCREYGLWKEGRKRKKERIKAERDSENSDRLLEKWRDAWMSLPRAQH